jgi:hypothetical protein
MRQIFVWLLISCFASASIQAQALQVRVQYGADQLELGKTYFSAALGDSLVFHTCKFYLSDIRLGNSKTPFHLVDVEDPNSFYLPFSAAATADATTLRFVLGVDSATTVSGAYDGALDPTNGMYWTWQTGYIHVKLEGVSRICPSRNHVFQLHLGGYAAPYNALQIVQLPIKSTNKQLVLSLDVEPFIAGMQLQDHPEIMSPSSSSINAAQKFAELFNLVEK